MAVPARYNLGALLKPTETELSRRLFASCLALHPRHVPSRLEAAAECFEEGKDRDAAQHITHVLQKRLVTLQGGDVWDDDTAAHVGLLADNRAKALLCTLAPTLTGPERALCHMNRGVLHHAMGNADNARHDYNEALRWIAGKASLAEPPLRASVHFNIATFDMQHAAGVSGAALGHATKAVEALEADDGTDESRWLVLCARGACRMRAGDFAGALADYGAAKAFLRSSEALRVRPPPDDAVGALVFANAATAAMGESLPGYEGRAEKDLKRALAMIPIIPELHQQHADLLSQQESRLKNALTSLAIAMHLEEHLVDPRRKGLAFDHAGGNGGASPSTSGGTRSAETTPQDFGSKRKLKLKKAAFVVGEAAKMEKDRRAVGKAEQAAAAAAVGNRGASGFARKGFARPSGKGLAPLAEH